MENEDRQALDLNPERLKSAKKGIIWVATYFAVLILALFGVIYLLNSDFNGNDEEVVSSGLEFSPAEQEIALPEPTPLDLSKYQIRVINGSGIAGEASRARQLIVDNGFSVEGVGNADSFDFTNTQIIFKEQVEDDFVGKLREFLGQRYEVEIENGDIESEEEFDVLITVGSSIK